MPLHIIWDAGEFAALAQRFLFAEIQRKVLANPTSSKSYQDVGYVRFGGWEQHLLRPTTVDVEC